MIKLIMTNGRQPVHIDPAKISYVYYAEREGNRVGVGSATFTVVESPEEVLAIIAAHKSKSKLKEWLCQIKKKSLKQLQKLKKR